MVQTAQKESVGHEAFPNFPELEKLIDRILDMPDVREDIDLAPVDRRDYLRGYQDALRAVKTQIIAHCKGF